MRWGRLSRVMILMAHRSQRFDSGFWSSWVYEPLIPRACAAELSVPVTAAGIINIKKCANLAAIG